MKDMAVNKYMYSGMYSKRSNHSSASRHALDPAGPAGPEAPNAPHVTCHKASDILFTFCTFPAIRHKLKKEKKQ